MPLYQRMLNMNKKLYEVADVKFCTITPSRAKKQETISKWYACANFMPDNVIVGEVSESYIAHEKELIIRKGDIVIKRIAPLFVNYINDIQDGIYAGNNLILVTANENVYSKYLAMILNDKIKALSDASSVGAVMKSVSRGDLEQMIIPIPEFNKQIVLGDAWYCSIELKKMRNRLNELEHRKVNHDLIQSINMSNGGNGNG